MICDFQLRRQSVPMKARYRSHIESGLHSCNCLSVTVHLSSFVSLIYISRVLNGAHFFIRHAPDMQPISFCFLNEDKSRHIGLMIVRFLWFPVPGGIKLHQRRFWWSDYCGAMLKESHALQSHPARRSSERSCAAGEINLICVGGGGGTLSL